MGQYQSFKMTKFEIGGPKIRNQTLTNTYLLVWYRQILKFEHNSRLIFNLTHTKTIGKVVKS